MGSVVEGTTFKTVEPNGSLTGVVEANVRGMFLRLVIFQRFGDMKFRTLCFPAGKEFESWGFIGSELRKLLDGEPRVTAYQNPDLMKQKPQFLPTSVNRVSFANVSEGGGNALKLRMRLNASWWSPVALCRTDAINPDWLWVEAKVKDIWDHAVFKFPSKSEALIIFNSKEEVNYLISLPVLAGSMPESDVHMLGKEMKEVFKGIPYHLRTMSIVNRIAGAICSSWEHEEESVTLCSYGVRVTLKNVILEEVPRVINLIEINHRFPVVIGILSADVDRSEEKAGAHHMSSPASQPSVGESPAGFPYAQRVSLTSEGCGPPGFAQGPILGE
ncbi:hypothetical protein FRX31_030126 [Thalictrum thalictroides]|uniref:Uncharacterized protein n=1 Tax=Thalictrum thalictroides TaxID=46969 RepID=A0A7J6V693_THATH|nr:hypothetical protein FRX31_030126 [Thalictrum thalictroides]